jgi:ubiquinone/menaquinone biosynthesis C-methylase UbiE
MDKRIFVVEDEVVVALDIQRALKKIGFVFAGMATSYDEAISGIKTSRPDLVLLDITLKQSKSGIEITKHLQSLMYCPFYLMQKILRLSVRYVSCHPRSFQWFWQKLLPHQQHDTFKLDILDANVTLNVTSFFCRICKIFLYKGEIQHDKHYHQRSTAYRQSDYCTCCMQRGAMQRLTML